MQRMLNLFYPDKIKSASADAVEMISIKTKKKSEPRSEPRTVETKSESKSETHALEAFCQSVSQDNKTLVVVGGGAAALTCLSTAEIAASFIACIRKK